METESSQKKPCFKCKKESHFLYKKSISVCRECFDLQIMKKKFRQNLRKQVDVMGKKNEVVAFLDGTLESIVVAKILGENLDRNLETIDKVKGKTILKYSKFYKLFNIKKNQKIRRRVQFTMKMERKSVKVSSKKEIKKRFLKECLSKGTQSSSTLEKSSKKNQIS